MSIQFNDTTHHEGLAQFYEEECGFNSGDISSNITELKKFAAKVNVAYDDFFNIGFKASGTWKLDDSNQTDYPIIRQSITSGQQDYPFTADENGNLVLGIQKVLIKKTPNGQLEEIPCIDRQTEQGNANFSNAISGVPTKYDKSANGIIFDYVPNYTASSGIEIHIDREPLYFTYNDTTKKPGVPGTLHKWFYLRPALDYIRIHGTSDQYTKVFNAVEQTKKEIEEFFRGRQKDVRTRLIANVESNK